MLSSLTLYHSLFESCLSKQSRWANTLAWVVGTFHTFQIDRCLNYSRIKYRQWIQNNGENTSETIRFSCSQPTQMGVTACYCAVHWDISAAIISLPGHCLGGLLGHPQHICAPQSSSNFLVTSPPVHLMKLYSSLYRGKYLAANQLLLWLKRRSCIAPGSKQIPKSL